ncbi:MAG: guanylate kinase [SAR324 cluster bacterium]|nr:guanylate kinase [SAR324 cluster bacterium]
MNNPFHPRVFVFSGPSGVGKTTIIAAVLRKIPDLRLSVSLTTRQSRPGEVDGKHYHFVDRKTFDEKIAAGEFLEWAKVYAEHYGTTTAQIKTILEEGHHALLDVDTQGAMNIKKSCSGPVLVFIEPPSLEELEKRLRGRGTESEESLARRISKAKHEMGFAREYDHVVVNDEVEAASENVVQIIQQEETRAIPFKT